MSEAVLDTIESSQLTSVSGGMYDSPLSLLVIPLLLGGWSRQYSTPSRPQPQPQPQPVAPAAKRPVGPPLDIRPAAQRRRA
jgi:hypothetical protein